MRFMTARTNEFTTRPQPFRGGCNGVSTHRMPQFDARQSRMTTSAELVDRFMKHKWIFGGMGIMAGYTAHSKENTVDVGHRVVFVKQLLFIIVTGETKPEGALGPELIPVLTPWGLWHRVQPPINAPWRYLSDCQFFLPV